MNPDNVWFHHVSPKRLNKLHKTENLCLVVGEQLIGASADVGIGPITWRISPRWYGYTVLGMDSGYGCQKPGGERLAKSP